MAKTDDDLSTKHGRLRAARKRRGFDQAKLAAEALGIPYGSYSGYEAGSRWFADDTELERVAKFFRVPVEWIAFGRGGAAAQNIVAVVGKIAAGNTIDVDVEHVSEVEPLFEIEIDVNVPPDAFALQVSGESMWPRYDDGDVIICYRHSEDPQTLVGWEAAVATAEGNRYLKRLMLGSEPGLYTLESHNAPPIRDVKVSWVSEVRHVVRASRWRKLDNGGRRRELNRVSTR